MQRSPSRSHEPADEWMTAAGFGAPRRAAPLSSSGSVWAVSLQWERRIRTRSVEGDTDQWPPAARESFSEDKNVFLHSP